MNTNNEEEVAKLTKLRKDVFSNGVTDDTWLDVVEALDDLIRVKKMTLADQANAIHQSITEDGECWGDSECQWCKHMKSCKAVNALCKALAEEDAEEKKGCEDVN